MGQKTLSVFPIRVIRNSSFLTINSETLQTFNAAMRLTLLNV
jgi:hypothetical protein